MLFVKSWTNNNRMEDGHDFQQNQCFYFTGTMTEGMLVIQRDKDAVFGPEELMSVLSLNQF